MMHLIPGVGESSRQCLEISHRGDDKRKKKKGKKKKKNTNVQEMCIGDHLNIFGGIPIIISYPLI